MKLTNTVIAWLVTIALAGCVTALAVAHVAVPAEISLAFTVALGAASGLSLPSGTSGTDVISELRQLLVDVTSVKAATVPPAPAPTLPAPAPATPNVTQANA